jgi:hypothetical protein
MSSNVLSTHSQPGVRTFTLIGSKINWPMVCRPPRTRSLSPRASRQERSPDHRYTQPDGRFDKKAAAGLGQRRPRFCSSSVTTRRSPAMLLMHS